MSSIPVFVGLDYHQDSVQVCVLNSSGKVLVNRSVRNDGGLIKSVSSKHGVPQRMAIEASGETIMRLLRTQCDQGRTAVLVTHNAAHAAWADRVLYLRDGKITDEVISNHIARDDRLDHTLRSAS